MIYVSHSLPINEVGQPVLDRDTVWEGLVLKANNALPFVPAMTQCEVVRRIDDFSFDRRIELFDAEYMERITLQPQRRVVFTRLSGPVLGTIVNDIEEVDGELSLRFSFALVLEDAESGSSAEEEYAEKTTAQYFAAVAGTLAAMRKVATGESSVN